MNTKTLDLTQPVQTKSGIKMRILCTDAPGVHSILCIDYKGTLYRYTLDGKYAWDGAPTEYDLINSPEMVEIDVWVNVYRARDGEIIVGVNHPTKEKAVNTILYDSICTLHIKRTVPVGHVDE